MKQRKLGREYLQENVGGVDVGLTSTALRRIDEVAPEDALLENDTPDGRWRWLIADLSTWHHALGVIVCTISPR
jgi:hypothetical protein